MYKFILIISVFLCPITSFSLEKRASDEAVFKLNLKEKIVYKDYIFKGEESLFPKQVVNSIEWTFIDYSNLSINSCLPVLFKIEKNEVVNIDAVFRDGFYISPTLSEEGFLAKCGKNSAAIFPREPNKMRGF